MNRTIERRQSSRPWRGESRRRPTVGLLGDERKRGGGPRGPKGAPRRRKQRPRGTVGARPLPRITNRLAPGQPITLAANYVAISVHVRRAEIITIIILATADLVVVMLIARLARPGSIAASLSKKRVPRDFYRLRTTTPLEGSPMIQLRARGRGRGRARTCVRPVWILAGGKNIDTKRVDGYFK